MVLLEETKNRTWWDTSIIPAFRRLKFKASLGYLLRLYLKTKQGLRI
jgi:hypothetical protein